MHLTHPAMRRVTQCPCARRQSGTGLVGFLAASVPTLALGLGGTELAHWMQIRQSLSLTLMDAARAGSTHQAKPEILAISFERGLRTLHPAPGEPERILQERRRTLGLPWHITILSPTPAAFTDHADPDLPEKRAYRGQPLIRNDRQDAQHATRVAQGWPQGRGAASGLTIHEANTLKLALHWPHRPLTPGISVILRSLAPLAQNPLSRQWMRAGYLPFQRQVAVAMQSPPALWPDLPDGRVTQAAATASAPLPMPPADPDKGNTRGDPHGSQDGTPVSVNHDVNAETPELPGSEKEGGTDYDAPTGTELPEAEECSPG